MTESSATDQSSETNTSGNMPDATEFDIAIYKHIFMRMKEGFVLMEIIRNEQGQIIDTLFLNINAQVARNLGKPKEEIIGKTRTEMFGPYDGKMIDRLEQALGQKENVNFEFYSSDADKWFDMDMFSPKPNLIAVISQDITQRKENENNLKDLEAKGMHALVRGQESERHRIALELHDGIQSLLSTVKVKLELLQIQLENPSTQLNEDLSEIQSTLEQAQNEVSSISRNLKPPALIDFGLVVALQNTCDHLEKHTLLKVQFIHSGNLVGLDELSEVSFYRIVQEALNNTKKHSGATAVTVQLIGHSDSIVLTIEDNGKGFKNDPNRTGLGLHSIMARTKALAGKLEIDSTPERGTTILVEIPRIVPQ